MNNTIIDSLMNSKSIRQYTDKIITETEQIKILNAAMSAPTAGNQQLYTIINIKEQFLKDELSITCDNQPFISQAKMVLVFCADCQKWYDLYLEAGASPRHPGYGDIVLAISDALIAAQNAVIAAWGLGIGSCYIGDIMENCEKHKEILKLPEYVFPATMVVFGYPTKQQKDKVKPKRCKMEKIVHENTYNRMHGDELRHMIDHELGDKTFEEWTRVFLNRKYNSDFAKEMSRSVRKYFKSFE